MIKSRAVVLLGLATKAGVEGAQPLEIHAPLLKMDKADIIKSGIALGVDYSMTSSCYDPTLDGKPCSSCDAWLLRAKAIWRHHHRLRRTRS